MNTRSNRYLYKLEILENTYLDQCRFTIYELNFIEYTVYTNQRMYRTKYNLSYAEICNILTHLIYGSGGQPASSARALRWTH